MKRYLALLIFTLAIISSCCPCANTTYTVPKGYRTCHNDYDCNRKAGEFCGFVGVNTYAVCRQ